MRSRTLQRPVLETIQDGLLISVIQEGSGKKLSEDDLVSKVREALHLSTDQAAEAVSASLTRLTASGEISKDRTQLTAAGSTNVYRNHIGTLAKAVLDRMSVREDVKVSVADFLAAQSSLEGLFMARAWDLAAHYAGASGGYAADVPSVIIGMVNEQNKHHLISSVGAMQRALLDLISKPDDKEAAMLADLGRTAFALQIVLSSPRQALFHRYTLPQRVYFDSNILMPAITNGHPLRPLYADAITRLRAAAAEAGSFCELCVGAQFLDEIFTHRRNAIEAVRQLHLEDPDQLARHISFYGPLNTNVFIGAYSSHVGRGKKRIRFNDFLSRVAPYKSEKQLEEHLKKLAIHTVKMDFHKTNNTIFNHIFSSLILAHERTSATIPHPKVKLLLQHEAQQLTQTHIDALRRLRSVFVTADMQLHRFLRNDIELNYLLGSVLSQIGFIGLVDIMVGLEADKRSFARILWASPRTETQKTLRDYLIKRALDEYDVGLTMEMPAIVDKLAHDATLAAQRRGINLASFTNVEDAARTAKFLETLENDYFSKMRAALEEKKEREKKQG